MAFLEFKCIEKEGKRNLCDSGNKFRLAGYNLIYKAWEKQGKPLNSGWRVSQDDLLRLHSRCQYDSSTRRLVIDYDPNSTKHIGLVELLEIYAFTWSDNGRATWTPLMLRLRDVLEEKYEQPFEGWQKAEILAELPDPASTANESNESVEFLYLNGDDKGWRWGMNGMTNAAFLHGAARDYFKQFF